MRTSYAYNPPLTILTLLSAPFFQMAMAGAAAGPGQAPAFNKIYAGERTELDILKHEFKVTDAEYR